MISRPSKSIKKFLIKFYLKFIKVLTSKNQYFMRKRVLIFSETLFITIFTQGSFREVQIAWWSRQ